jgi:hypothetical protein
MVVTTIVLPCIRYHHHALLSVLEFRKDLSSSALLFFVVYVDNGVAN